MFGMYDTEMQVSVNGVIWCYGMYREYEEDNVKNFHFLWQADTPAIKEHIDWSPYSCMLKEDLILYIEEGCPARDKLGINGPVNGERLRAWIESRS